MKKLRRNRSSSNNFSNQGRNVDRTLFGMTVLLTILGLIAVADVSAPMALSRFGEAYYFIRQQLMWAVLGVIGLIVGAKVNYLYWRKIAGVLFIVLLAL